MSVTLSYTDVIRSEEFIISDPGAETIKTKNGSEETLEWYHSPSPPNPFVKYFSPAGKTAVSR
jgi:hypothetical protein